MGADLQKIQKVDCGYGKGEMKEKPETRSIDAQFISTVTNYVTEGRAIKKKLPTINGGILIERQLPYLCLYRLPEAEFEVDSNFPLDWGTDQLLYGESSYLVGPGEKKDLPGLSSLISSVATSLKESYGAFLLVEIWSGEEVVVNEEVEHRKPGFKIYTKKNQSGNTYVKRLAKELSLIHLNSVPAKVEMVSNETIAPDKMASILSDEKIDELKIHFIGIEVAPVYRSGKASETYTLVLQKLQSQFTKALEKMFFEFLKHETTVCPPSYLALGKRSPVHAVVEVDRILSEVADEIDFLLLVTPTNADDAYFEFKHNLFRREPLFEYHPIPFDPVILKRKLYSAPVEQIEDPTLARLFREQQVDIGQRINMVSQRGTRNFMYSSLQLFEAPGDDLVEMARRILTEVPERSEGESLDHQMTAEEFRDRAEEELDFYKSKCPDLPATVTVRDDVPGVLVSSGNLIIGAERKILTARAEALLSHEVGTHILTNYNGKAQPFRQLSAGLPGYDELQEPLAVLSEYLVGGLSNRRMRTIAARVLAVHWMVDGASFVEVFRKFTKEFNLHNDIAYSITMRVFRGGGFTKDVVYLRGLVSLLEHIRHGLDIEMLYIGKFGLNYLPIIRELLWRKVLVEAKLKPHFFESEESMKRLESIKSGKTILDLVSN